MHTMTTFDVTAVRAEIQAPGTNYAGNCTCP